MDAATLLQGNIPLVAAINGLIARTQPQIGNILGVLRPLKHDMEYVKILHHYVPEQSAWILREKLSGATGPYGLGALESAVLSLLGNLFPIAWMMEEDFAEEPDAEHFILIEPFGNPVGTWDDWDNFIESADDYPDGSLLAFVMCLSRGEDATTMQRLAEVYQWPEMEPKWFAESVSVSYDLDEVREALRERGLERFVPAFEVYSWSSDNIFLGFNPYDAYDGFRDPLHPEWYSIPFTLEKVQWLRSEYQIANAIMHMVRALDSEVAEDPSVLSEIFDAFDDAAEYTDFSRNPNRTLAEVWADDETDDGTLEEVEL